MTVNKRKRNSRHRGSHTHGWGAMKKHRGAGNRGGRGHAGTGKRADQKKTQIWKDKDYFGKKGFKKKGIVPEIDAINAYSIELKLEDYMEKKLVSYKDGVYTMQLGELGYNKLLGSGKLKNKYKIFVKYASDNAIRKVEEAGGEVILTHIPKKEEPAKTVENIDN